jgi:abortive infection bacteriophage resistance protein
MTHRTYNKTYSSPRQIATILKDRGLIIDNLERAEQYLKNIGYYRLSAYLYPLLALPKENKKFKEGASFDQGLMLYRFDRKLRLLIFNQIEKIEIAIRSAIINITCHELGDAFWITNSKYFADKTKFENSIIKIRTEYNRSQEDFILHFKSSYSNEFPPAWILAEILPFGVLTSIYNNLANFHIRKKIAKAFGLHLPVFISWLTIITVTRNSCCHHARIWNREWSLRARSMNKMDRPWISNSVKQGRIFFTLCVIKYFANIIVPNNDLKDKLARLLTDFPNIDIRAMGFPDNWDSESPWI